MIITALRIRENFIKIMKLIYLKTEIFEFSGFIVYSGLF